MASYHNKIQNRQFSELGTKKNTEIGPASLAAKPGSILKGLILINNLKITLSITIQFLKEQ